MIKQNILELPVYYINLDKDTAKKEAIEILLADLGFNNVNRFSGIQKPIKRNGVAASHNALLHELKNENTPFIVLEDDLVNINFISDIDIPENADAMYLGNSLYGLYSGKGHLRVSAEQYSENVYRVYNMLAAHAIMYLNKDYVKFLAQATDFSIRAGTNQDIARAETMKYWNVYATSKPLFAQSGAHLQFTKSPMSKALKSGPEGAYK
jgi:hypothetical protein